MKLLAYCFVFIICFGVGLTSCQKTMFRPEQVHDPMIKKTGELNVNTSFMLFSLYGAGTIDLGLGYAPINNISIKAAARILPGRNAENDTTSSFWGPSYATKRKSFDIGIGYFKNIDKRFTFSIYGGSIFGKTVYTEPLRNNGTPGGFLQYKYQLIYLQPSIVYNKKKIKMGLGTRIGHYSIKNLTLENIGYYPSISYSSLASKNYILGEPYFNFEVGKRRVYFNTQISYSLVPKAITGNVHEFNLNFNLGIKLLLSAKKNK